MEKLINEFLEQKKYYSKTELCDIMNKYGSDKGNFIEHNYTTLYKLLFPYYDNTTKIFELGLGTNNIDVKSNMGIHGKPCASVYGWNEYFNTTVYGADIDSNILEYNHKIKTFHCDQTDINSINKLWKNNDLNDLLFDIIIDDGLHEYEANITFFENSFHKLKKDGIYIIEDVFHTTLNDWKKYIMKLNVEYSNIIEIPLSNNNYNNNIILIKK